MQSVSLHTSSFNSFFNGCFWTGTEYMRHNPEAIKMRDPSGSILRKVPSHFDIRKQLLYRKIFGRGYDFGNGVVNEWMRPFVVSEIPRCCLLELCFVASNGNGFFQPCNWWSCSCYEKQQNSTVHRRWIHSVKYFLNTYFTLSSATVVRRIIVSPMLSMTKMWVFFSNIVRFITLRATAILGIADGGYADFRNLKNHNKLITRFAVGRGLYDGPLEGGRKTTDAVSASL